MTSRTALSMLLLATLAGTVSVPSAEAARVSMSGEDLDLAIPCTGQVRIVVDSTMKDGATLDSSSATQVTMRTGKEEADSRISIATKACAPNGKLTISVSPYTGVSIHDSHDTSFVIKGKLASLDASLDSNAMDVENTQSLDLSMHGSSNVHIGSLERAAQIVASGTSTFTADSAQLTALSAQLTNQASFTISQGDIEALTIVTADSASATVLGNASVATVTANGTGTVNIERVSGPIVRSGSGSVRVGAQNGVVYRSTDATPAPTPAPASLAPEVSAPPPTAIPEPIPATPVAPPPPASAPQTSTPQPSAPPAIQENPASPNGFASAPPQLGPQATLPSQTVAPPSQTPAPEEAAPATTPPVTRQQEPSAPQSAAPSTPAASGAPETPRVDPAPSVPTPAHSKSASDEASKQGG
ncbi:hypothetical protein [Gluconobacter japonicus]|uniref:Uncharacterized protein n=1 Tax=Gluconobacter japonicus TaxID=376620 RepID=A0ABQ5WKH7_GLUJA|nr:hypothetical protein [Gluconobacter japonicus]KXV27245.1 hypothetical protein AD938_07575 [Gluconobacter japonicus]GBR22254.1 hypothetical protein AA3271_1208 [Gluconobacter japonicus NBRC 3271]GLQ60303.1 hypothetical protein GCM10010937_21060 [Gluconobacter japonicus]